jgi:hypothetical protein
MYETFTVDMIESEAILVAGPLLPLGPPTKKPRVLSKETPLFPRSALLVGIAAFLSGYLITAKK